MLLSFQAAMVLGDALTLEVDRYHFGTGLHRNLSAAVCCRNGVVVRIKTNRAEAIHTTAGTLTRVKGITGQRI